MTPMGRYLLNMRGCQIYVIGVGNCLMMTRTVFYGFKAKVR